MISSKEKIFLIKTTGTFTPDQKLYVQLCVELMKTLRKSMIDQECLISKIEQLNAEDPSAKLYFRPKCDSNVEKEEESCENSDVKDDEEEIQLKGIFFDAELLQVLLTRNFYQWINVVPSKTLIPFLEH